jgi:hypothetical protein
MRRKLIIGAIVVVFVLGVLVTRAVWEGRGALADGDAALARGDTRTAIEHWSRAARWYAPLAPHVEQAYERLEQVATQAEAAGDPETAVVAWRAVRSAVLATRAIYTPHAERRTRADARIAALMATQAAGPAPADAGATVAARTAFYGKQLADDGAPSRAWALIALAGFGLWIGGAVHFARRGLDAADQLVGRAAGTSGGLIAVGVLVWVVGLYNA